MHADLRDSRSWRRPAAGRKAPTRTGGRGSRGLRPTLERLESIQLLSGLPDSVLVSAGPTPQQSAYTPAQIRQFYGFDQLPTGTNGAGTTIAIIDFQDDPSIRNDLAIFDRQFLANDSADQNPSLTIVGEDGSANLPPTADPNTTVETSLDVEYAHAIAPAAKILLVEMNVSSAGGTPQLDANAETHILTAVDTARNTPGVTTISMSFGLPETANDTSNNFHFLTPSGHAGVEFVASTGDSGGPAMWPSSSPQVLAVGGTTIGQQANGSLSGESAWSFGDPVYGSSNGGVSQYQYEPDAQRPIQATNNRTVPDVAYNAGAAVAVYDSQIAAGSYLAVGGTSAGAPQWAGLIALADQGRIAAGTPTLEGLNPVLNPAAVNAPAYYHDITTGRNGSYSAGPGYDLVTGVGSPVANALVPELTAETYASPDQISGFYGPVGDWFTRIGDANMYSKKFIFGAPTSYPLAGDYDGLGHAEPAVYSNGTQTWTIDSGYNPSGLYDANTSYSVQFGAPGDVPVPGDYTHSGHTEIAVYRPSSGQWFILPNFGPQYGSSNVGPGEFIVQFGGSGDEPVAADYTGAGHFDPAVFRPSSGQWFILPNFGPQYGGNNQGPGGFIVQFGGGGAVPVPGDYTGTNHAAVAVYYPLNSTWAIDPTFGPQYGGSNQGPGGFIVQFGGPGDTPVPGNYTGHVDIAVYRPDLAEWDVDPNFGPQYGGTNQGPDGYTFAGQFISNLVPVSSAVPISYGEASGTPVSSIFESLGGVVIPLPTSLPSRPGPRSTCRRPATSPRMAPAPRRTIGRPPASGSSGRQPSPSAPAAISPSRRTTTGSATRSWRSIGPIPANGSSPPITTRAR